MAKCDVCHQEMLESKGCSARKVIIGNRAVWRIPVGGRGDWGEGESADYICADCAAPMGGYHHWGCDAERCPVCGGQLLSCECGENAFVLSERRETL